MFLFIISYHRICLRVLSHDNCYNLLMGRVSPILSSTAQYIYLVIISQIYRF